MKKVISFSLWGDNPVYTIGALLNADKAEEEWKDWICRYYVAPTVPAGIIEELNSRENVELIHMDEDQSWNGMFWRFFPASDPTVDVAIFRDSDSVLHIRDKMAVDEWIRSNKGVHIMRDNCQHGFPICGGMWGTKKDAIPELKELILHGFDIEEKNKHGVDQLFLRDKVYPLVMDNIYVHDEWFPALCPHEEKHPFPIPRLRGDGWWKREFPDWHCGLQLDKGDEHWFRNEECKHPECCLPCPACGILHDNEYIGKVYDMSKEDFDKYLHIETSEIKNEN